MANQDQTRGAAAGIARGALIIAGLTVLSRILGLVRTLVLAGLAVYAWSATKGHFFGPPPESAMPSVCEVHRRRDR